MIASYFCWTMDLIFQKKYFFSLLLVLLMVAHATAQKRMSTEEYIEKYKDVAIKKMREFKIPASITLAQGVLESGSGNSRLATKANNHFGIKCHKGWNGKKFYMDDDEKHECFRKYHKADDSFRDHSKFLTQRGRYSFLFQYDITDYEKWAYGLKKAGYATNPKYPKLLIKIIEKYNLSQYDKEALGKKYHKKKKKAVVKESPVDEGPMPVVALFKVSESNHNGRRVLVNNKRKLIIAQHGDNYELIASDFGIYSWQLFKYNEVSKKHKLTEGELVYLEKKKSKAEKKYKIHYIRQGESLHDVAQLYGMKLSKLLRMNNLPDGISVPVGTKIRVR